jgi:hypothetical protein
MGVTPKMLSQLRDSVGLELFEIDGDVLMNKAARRGYSIKIPSPCCSTKPISARKTSK